MSESTDELQHMILHLRRERQKVVLKMNMKKTKVMFIHEIEIDDKVKECDQEYIYLRHSFVCSDLEKIIKRRIGMGWSTFGR